MLWEVTDFDCDRFTVRLLDFLLGSRKENGSDFFPPPEKRLKREPEISRAVALSRRITKSFLNGAAAVVYGLPLRVVQFHEVLSVIGTSPVRHQRQSRNGRKRQRRLRRRRQRQHPYRRT